MNRYESVLLDKIVDVWVTHGHAVESMNERSVTECEYAIANLLDCIVDFREPPKSLAVEDGHGVLVKGEK